MLYEWCKCSKWSKKSECDLNVVFINMLEVVIIVLLVCYKCVIGGYKYMICGISVL